MKQEYITKSQVIELVGNNLNLLLSTREFKYVKSKESFIRKTDFRSEEIVLNVKNFWPLQQDINLPLVIINQRINQITKEFYIDINNI